MRTLSQTSKKIKALGVIVALILLLVFLNNILPSKPAERALVAVVAPFNSISLNISGFFFKAARFFTGIKDLNIENGELVRKNAELEAKIVRLGAVEEENRLFRQQLGFQEKQKIELKEAEMTGFGPHSFSHYATLNKGAKDGISENMPVIIPGNILFGRVQKTYDKYSLALLISDQSNKVNVKSESLSASGVLSGSAGGSMLLMDLIERESELNKDDLILTSGLDGVYPKDLIVGRVAEIASAGEGVFKQAFVRPSYSGFLDTKVFVIVSPR